MIDIEATISKKALSSYEFSVVLAQILSERLGIEFKAQLLGGQIIPVTLKTGQEFEIVVKSKYQPSAECTVKGR